MEGSLLTTLKWFPMGGRGMGIKGNNKQEDNFAWNNDGNMARMKKMNNPTLDK